MRKNATASRGIDKMKIVQLNNLFIQHRETIIVVIVICLLGQATWPICYAIAHMIKSLIESTL